jgi:hypothetical protein
MTWDFGEANVFGRSNGSWLNTIKHMAKSLEVWGSSVQGARISIAAAASTPVSPDFVISTGPRFETIKKVVSAQNERVLDIVAEVYGSVVMAGIHKAPSIKVAEAANSRLRPPMSPRVR